MPEPISTATPSVAAPLPRLDPTLAVALAMHATPGAYALLLGSGLSRDAGIPTGWEVVIDLIAQIAPADVERTGAALEAWYRQAHGREPDYSDLIELLAATPTERRERLRRYFEPTEQEREDGSKLPTAAHRAIAQLVARGIVRVMVTTNFDQLLEAALREVGVVPAVLSTADAIQGAMPLHHQAATIVKLHGDYTDVRIKNTTAELAVYAPEVDALLDRILDEYGMIVCGWSATWDPALRAAILRAPNRRFSMFWSHVGEPTEDAKKVIAHRAAVSVPVAGANAFFSSVVEKIVSLDEMRSRHPTGVAMAVATLKRYLPREEDRIRLHDLVAAEVEEVRARVIEVIPTARPTGETITTTVNQLVAASETLTAMAATGAFWWEPRHGPLWIGALERLGNVTRSVPGDPNFVLWIDMLRYSAQLVYYALGVTLSATRNDAALMHLLLTPRIRTHDGELQNAAVALSWSNVLEGHAKDIPQYANNRMPASEQLFDAVRPALAAVIPDEAAYTQAFERFELLAALAFAHEKLAEDKATGWFPVGRSAWRWRLSFGSNNSLARLGKEMEAAGEAWGPLQHGLFSGSAEQAKAQYSAMLDFLRHVNI